MAVCGSKKFSNKGVNFSQVTPNTPMTNTPMTGQDERTKEAKHHFKPFSFYLQMLSWNIAIALQKKVDFHSPWRS